MTNRDKIEMLRMLHSTINDQLSEAIEAGENMEDMRLYTIGIGNQVFTFPATLIYRVMFDHLFAGWDELKDDSMAGINGPVSTATMMDAISEIFDETWQKLDELNDKYSEEEE